MRYILARVLSAKSVSSFLSFASDILCCRIDILSKMLYCVVIKMPNRKRVIMRLYVLMKCTT